MSTADTLVSCGQCSESFRLHESKPRQSTDAKGTKKFRRALQCGHCGRACCTACQRSDQSCSCGQRNWRKVYFEIVYQSWWQKLLGR